MAYEPALFVVMALVDDVEQVDLAGDERELVHVGLGDPLIVVDILGSC